MRSKGAKIESKIEFKKKHTVINVIPPLPITGTHQAHQSNRPDNFPAPTLPTL